MAAKMLPYTMSALGLLSWANAAAADQARSGTRRADRDGTGDGHEGEELLHAPNISSGWR